MYEAKKKVRAIKHLRKEATKKGRNKEKKVRAIEHLEGDTFSSRSLILLRFSLATQEGL